MNAETTKWVLIGSSTLAFVAFVLSIIALATNDCDGGRGFRGGMMGWGQPNIIKQENGQNGETFRGRMMQRVAPRENTTILSGEQAPVNPNGQVSANGQSAVLSQ